MHGKEVKIKEMMAMNFSELERDVRYQFEEI